MSETEIQKQIIDFLKKKGWLVFRMNAGLVKKGSYTFHLSPKGTPDLMAVGPEVLIWIEVKAGKAKPTPEQLEQHAALRVRGQKVVVVWSLDELKVCIDPKGWNNEESA